MGKESIQIICIYRGQRKETVKRTMDSLANAVKIEKEKSSFLEHCIVSIALCGPDKKMTSVEWKDLQNEYSAYFTLKTTNYEESVPKARIYNELAGTSKTTYIILLHIEAVVNTHFLVYMLEPVRSKERIGIVEAKQLPIESPKEFDKLTNETSCALGEWILICRHIFEECHGLDDTTFPNIGWDVDFSWRIRLNGYRVYYQCLASVVMYQKLSFDFVIDVEESEGCEAVLTTILMAYKWSHNGLVEKYIKTFEASDTACQKKAVMLFQQMKVSGSLPAQIDSDHKIARFYEGTGYTKYRYMI